VSEPSPFVSAPDKKNAIVVCCTANYMPYAAVTLLSCSEHGAQDVADFHLVVPDATEEALRDFSAFVDSKSMKVNLHCVELDPSSHELEHNSFSVGAVMRLYLDRWISPDYDRVLYLDSDVLAVGPVAPIFDLDLGGKPIGAVEDVQSIKRPNGLRREAEYFRQLGLKPHSAYFNSGVLLMDWKAVLSGNRLRNCIKTGLRIRASGVVQKFADQDILNIEFENDWVALSIKYNVLWYHAPHLRMPTVFRHFAGSLKPWHDILGPCTLEYAGIYRKYLEGSPWQMPKRLRWRKDSEVNFRIYLLNRFNLVVRRAVRAQFPSH
jgi:lipopolysaccharide biosynthesis glycosyltransferase